MFSASSASPVRRRGVARRLAAAALLSGLFATGSIAGASTAVADEGVQQQGGAVATLNGLKTFDKAVLHGRPIDAGLFEMTVDGGGLLKTYCIDINNPTQRQAKYLETSWGQTSLASNKNAGKILWILEHSYPKVDDLAALAKDAGIEDKNLVLSEKTAAAGTQVAIWRYSDGADVTAADPAAEKLADWLQEKAQDVEEPKASLSLEPNAVSGKAGSRIGPVTVRTDATEVTVTPPADAAASGIKITDEAGKPVTSAKDGTKLYFDVPATAADGSATLSVQATTSVPVGRAFVGATTKSQVQILADSSESTVTANATASWAKTGAIPAVTAEKNCAEGGVDITASNKGDSPFTFELAGLTHTIPAGESKTVTIPVAEDQAYDFTITGPDGFKKNFKGVLDCKTAGTPAPEEPSSEPTPSSQPSAASAGGTSAGTGVTAGVEGDLAETGSSSATPMIAGIAIALVVAGGGAVFFLRKKRATAAE
ncbi:LAETG motif-containing sortase-dependent surface protein [Streptomyces sp. NPDC052236]|uniref:LAETG motif-containing sortase-dependent surface protein n=1 Tax=Streptomyces sp. NPDC052236 TaxID=3365686 RepID=UPI0037D03171